MSFEVLEEIDRILNDAGCPYLFEEICEIVFGGYYAEPDKKSVLANVSRAGSELRRCEGLPLAVAVPPGIGFFLFVWAVEHFADRRMMRGEMGLDKVQRRMEKIERRHGVGDELIPWKIADAPASWQAANAELERIADIIMADSLRSVDPALAELFHRDQDDYNRRRETGRGNLLRLIGREDLLENLSDPAIDERAELEMTGS